MFTINALSPRWYCKNFGRINIKVFSHHNTGQNFSFSKLTISYHEITEFFYHKSMDNININQLHWFIINIEVTYFPIVSANNCGNSNVMFWSHSIFKVSAKFMLGCTCCIGLYEILHNAANAALAAAFLANFFDEPNETNFSLRSPLKIICYWF